MISPGSVVDRGWEGGGEQCLRDWSLITGGGGYKTGGGHVKFYPYEKGGRKKFWPF